MAHNTSPTTSWVDIRRALIRHKRKATLVFIAVVAVAVVGTILVPRVYRSEAMLLVRLGRENAVLDTTATAGGDRVVAIPTSREDEINSVVEVLKSRALAEKVVDALGPDVILARHAATDTAKQLSSTAELSNRNQAVLACLRKLKVQAARRSNIIQLAYDSPSPELAQTVAARFVDIFLDEHVRMHRSEGSHEFFARQAAKLRADLDSREEELRDLKNETGLTSPEDQRKLLVERVSAMETEVLRVDLARAASQSKVAALREKLASLPVMEVSVEDDGYSNEGTDDMRNQFYALRLQEEEAAARYTDQYPKMRELRQKSAEAKRLLDAEEGTRKHVSTTPNRLRQETLISLLTEEPLAVSLQAQAAKLHLQLAEVRRDLVQLNNNERRIVKLQREVALAEANYRKYAASLEQSRIDTALEDQRISNISVVQSASFDPKPISPRVALNLGLGLLAGICGAVGLALGKEHFAQSIHSPEDIEKELLLPALGTIPRFTQEQVAVAIKR